MTVRLSTEMESNMKGVFGIKLKRIAGISALSLLGSVLAVGAVQTNAKAETLSTSPVTLTVQYETSTAPETEWHAIAAAFQKLHPNVTVAFSPITNDAKGGSNLQVLTSDGAPDIALVPLNSNVYTQMVAAQQLVPLDGIFAADNTVKRIGPPAAALKQADGHYYATPHNVVYYNILWANPVAIKASKVFLPSTKRFSSVDSLIHFTKGCQKHGYAGIAIGGNTNYQASWMLDSMLPSAVSADALHNYINNYKSTTPVTAHYTDAGFVNTLTALQKIAKSGAYQTGYLGQDANQAVSLFTSGKACLLLGGSWMPGGAFADATKAGTMNFTPSFATLPGVNPGTYGSLNPYYGDAFGVPQKSKNQAWALELLRYFISDTGQTLGSLEAAGNIPAVTTIPKAKLAAILPAAVQQVLAFVARNGAQSGWTSEVPGAFGQTFINPLIQQIQAGSLTPTQVAQKQEDEMNSVRKNGL
jgi:raffinose/stachyose/melibiose transport system substrate-binding protein